MRTAVIIAAFATLLGTATSSNAQTPNGECSGGLCGAPNQSGGGCGCGCGCSILINFTDQGDTYQYADDFDDDGIEDDFDNCPFTFNPDQGDGDGDVRGDLCDNCALAANFDLSNVDADAFGDACDPDADNDGFDNTGDNCRLVPNPGQENGGFDPNDFDVIVPDGDALGNACDDNDDDDNCADFNDGCPLVREADCLNSAVVQADKCFPDLDADFLHDSIDNCETVPNADQSDRDGDGQGDLCDNDLDNDGHDNTVDNCPQVPNGDLNDIDRDFRGDACDPLLCYVVTDESSCLDPTAPFAVHAGKTLVTTTGQDALLHIFANRENTHIQYTWRVVSGPNGKTDGATITNPTGAVSVSSSIEYIYEGDREARFSAREPGEYQIELLGELVWPQYDDYPESKTAKSVVTVQVGGEALPAFFCGAAPGSTAAAGVLLGLLAIVRRRRR